MARGFLSTIARVAREVERDARRRERESQRLAKQAVRLDKIAYKESRLTEVEQMNLDIKSQVEALDSILRDGLAGTAGFSWNSLVALPPVSFAAPPSLATLLPPTPGLFARMLPALRRKHEIAMQDAHARHQQLQKDHQSHLDAMRRLREDEDAQIAAIRKSFADGDPETVCEIVETALEAMRLPDGFPQVSRSHFAPGSSQLVLDYQLPAVDEVVPEDDRHRYVQASDTIVSTKRSAKSQQEIYNRAVAGVVLRVIHHIFRLDSTGAVQTVVLNAYLDTTDPSTGQGVRPYLISVSTSRDAFQLLDLRHVEPIQCLKRLKAQVSRNSSELVSVRPIVDITTYDARFIPEEDLISKLDSRSNLMELTPTQFENLITNLFQKMGLDTRLTRASRDGGVDCVAYDLRPVLGGKIIVQAKRYKNTVGVSAVRDLYGALQHEGATKGILVTTSSYGPAAYEFAKDKPLQLIDGPQLIGFVKEHAGVDARIDIPEDWVEPVLQS